MQRPSSSCSRSTLPSQTAPNPYEVPGCQETHAPEERMFGVFPLSWSWRHRSLATCADVISLSRPRHRVSAPHTSGGSVTMAMVSAETRGYGPLRPRNLSVPSSRPLQRGGATPRVRPFGPGAGEGPHTGTGSDARRLARAGAEVQATAQGSGPKRLWAPTRALTPCDAPRPTGQAEPMLVP